MHSDIGSPKEAQDQSGADEIRVVKNRQAWERPALQRFDTADAEGGGLINIGDGSFVMKVGS